MGKNRITHSGVPRKDIFAAAENGRRETGKGRPGTARFTPSELAEMAAFDAALDDAGDVILTKEELAGARWLDAEARAEAAPREQGRGKPPKTTEQLARAREQKRRWREAHREQVRASNARYNEAHRQERRDYQRAYDAAHREEINAKARARRAEKRKEQQ